MHDFFGFQIRVPLMKVSSVPFWRPVHHGASATSHPPQPHVAENSLEKAFPRLAAAVKLPATPDVGMQILENKGNQLAPSVKQPATSDVEMQIEENKQEEVPPISPAVPEAPAEETPPATTDTNMEEENIDNEEEADWGSEVSSEPDAVFGEEPDLEPPTGGTEIESAACLPDTRMETPEDERDLKRESQKNQAGDIASADSAPRRTQTETAQPTEEDPMLPQDPMLAEMYRWYYERLDEQEVTKAMMVYAPVLVQKNQIPRRR